MVIGSSEFLLRNCLVELWTVLCQRRRKQLGLAVLMMLFSSLAEMISLGAVVPFLAVLSQPQQLWKLSFVQTMAPLVGWKTPTDIVVPVCALFAWVALCLGGVRILSLRLNVRLASAVGSDLSSEVYRRILYQPYVVQLRRNSSEVLTSLTNQIEAVVKVLTNLLQLATGVVIVCGLVLMLGALNPSVCLGLGIAITLAYGLVICHSRLQLVVLGRRIVADETRLLRLIQEGLGAIREVILDGSQSRILANYQDADRRLRWDRGSSQVLAFYPRYALESIGIALIAGAAVLLRYRGTSLLGELPLLGVVVLGAQRLLPTLQIIYSCWAQTMSNLQALQLVLSYLRQPLAPEDLRPTPEPLPLRMQLKFQQVSFRYEPESAWVLRELNLSIQAGERIGLIGRSGSGKSTCLDLLMGLLEPETGTVTVDGQPLWGEALRAWRQGISHVPQSIFLSDASIAENIALGTPGAYIDAERLRWAACQAHIEEFIETLPCGYRTATGERGVCLSGGQRQRLGIARALYRRASLLVLDEATSALDNETEKVVMDSIFRLSRELTIIIVSHRMSTLWGCDRVLEIKGGQAVREWNPAEICSIM